MHYDPNVPPSASAWLALDESERIALIEEAHAGDMPDPQIHAVIHAAVETQIAMELASVVDAMARLQAQGLDRHDALHAVGSVLARHMWEMLRGNGPLAFPGAEYLEDLDQLSAESWRREYE